MEYFRIINKQVTEAQLQNNITPETVDTFAESMLFLEPVEPYFKGVTLWGEFNISYDLIKGGVRFTLLDCPNALSWTITTGYPPAKEKIILHCTINRIQKPGKFVNEILEFLDEWEEGLLKGF